LLTEFFDFGGRLFGAFQIEVVNDDGAAFLGQRDGDSPAKAYLAAGSGYHSYFTLQPEFHYFPPA
jgi:hypothetical protein